MLGIKKAENYFPALIKLCRRYSKSKLAFMKFLLTSSYKTSSRFVNLFSNDSQARKAGHQHSLLY